MLINRVVPRCPTLYLNNLQKNIVATFFLDCHLRLYGEGSMANDYESSA